MSGDRFFRTSTAMAEFITRAKALNLPELPRVPSPHEMQLLAGLQNDQMGAYSPYAQSNALSNLGMSQALGMSNPQFWSPFGR